MFFFGLSSLAFWLLIVMGIAAVMRSSSRQPVPPPPHGYGVPGPYGHPGPPSVVRPPTAEQILAERFARGEIDQDEFWQRMTTLRAGRQDDPSGPIA